MCLPARKKIMGFQMIFKLPHLGGKLPDSFTGTGHRFHNRRYPIILTSDKRLQSTYLTLDPFRAFVVTLVDHKDIRDLHNPRLNALDVIAHARHKNYNRDVCEPDNIHFILADPNGFHQNQIAARSVQQRSNVSGSRSQAPERASRGHAADINSRVSEVSLHADAVT